MKDLIRSWAQIFLLFSFWSTLQQLTLAQNLELPSDYGIDLQVAEAGRSRVMSGSSEITGTAANGIGETVFHRLISASSGQPYAWQLTLVNNNVMNATSTAGGKLYIHGGMLSILGQNKGLWAAVLSHETAHTVRRHQVRIVLQELFNQRMIQYYRVRAAAGDKSANWGLIGFSAASRIALKKLERDQEHDADQQGMLLMARAGYHPDFVFALHHLLLMHTGERSKFAAFFSDHPRWETRDQRSDKVYADALAEFNRLWPDPASSPGGRPPVVAFLGQPEARENKQSHTADVAIAAYCRNSDEPIDLLVIFQKDGHSVKAADPQFADRDGNLAFHDKADCLEKNETTPIRLSITASAVANQDRSLKGTVYVGNHGELIAASKAFDIHFPSAQKASPNHARGIVEIAHANAPNEQARSDGSIPFKTAQGMRLPESSRMEPAKASAPPTKAADEGTLTITSTNEGAEIFVDSAGRGKAPGTFKVKSGKHSVQVVLAGYQDWVQEVSVNVGEIARVTANLRPVGAVLPETQRVNATPPDATRVEVPAPLDHSPAESSPGSTDDYAGGIGVTGMTGAYGVIITDVTLGSPAQEAGLKIGDTIIGIDDKPIKTTQMMESASNPRAPGSKMKVSYIRNRIAAETTLTVRRRTDLK